MAYFPTQTRDGAGRESEALPQEHKGLQRVMKYLLGRFRSSMCRMIKSQHGMFGGERRWAPSKTTGNRRCGEAVGGRAGETLTASLRAIKALEVDSGARCRQEKKRAVSNAESLKMHKSAAFFSSNIGSDFLHTLIGENMIFWKKKNSQALRL